MTKRLHRIALTVAALAAGLTLIAGCATSDQAESVLSDEDIVMDVQDRLRNDSMTAKYTYGVQSDQGLVTVTGFVQNEAVRARVLDIARGAEGVKGVVDNLTR
jgi:osmotically-inducible protein OsmY